VYLREKMIGLVGGSIDLLLGGAVTAAPLALLNRVLYCSAFIFVRI